MEKKKDLITAGLLVVIAGVLFAGTFTIKQRTESIIGPKFMPMIIIIALLLCALVIAVMALRAPKQAAAAEPEKKEPKEKLGIFDLIFDRYATITMWVVLIAYALCLKPVGFIPSSAVMVFLLCLLLAPKQERHYVKFAILAVVGSVAIYFIFVKLFLLILPKGILSAIL